MANTTLLSFQQHPLRLGFINLMPNKDETECQFMTWLKEAGVAANVTPLRLDSYQPRHAPNDYFKRYTSVSEIWRLNLDGLIITGAPIGRRDLVQGGTNGVDYYNELSQIYSWAATNVGQTLSVCWAAAAALKHFRGIERELGASKFFGVSQQRVVNTIDPLTRVLGASYDVPVSRSVIVRPEAVMNLPDFDILSFEPQTGLGLARDRINRQVLCFNHFEYEADRLRREYVRDVAKGINPPLPVRYDVENPQLTWQQARGTFMRSWLHSLRSEAAMISRPARHQLRAAMG